MCSSISSGRRSKLLGSSLSSEMGRLVYVTGGARSGKSSFAETRACAYARVCYVATAVAFDDEMRSRIACHQADRAGRGWSTLECPLDAAAGVAQADAQAVLLDCVTVLLSNILLQTDFARTEALADAPAAERAAQAQLDALLAACKKTAADVIVVSNEVGMGIVPDTPLGRLFRDIAGRANQRLAAAADEAYLLVSGLPVRLK